MKSQKTITILATETSCDDTCVAILKAPRKNGGFKILSNTISSQVKIHKKWGGVYPMMAKREHQKNLVPVLVESLKKAKILKAQSAKLKAQSYGANLKTINKILEREPELLKQTLSFLKKYRNLHPESLIQTGRRVKNANRPDIDLIAVTNGPGLEPCLWVGVNFAKALAYYWDIPIVTVNHVEAHIFANFVGENSKSQISKINFPAVALIVSGGHTQLILIRGLDKYEILGETRDDAAGECFDKTARILGLGYPGGPAIAAKAAKFTISNLQFSIKLPRPMINSKDYDFSFSGLKTAVLYKNKESRIKNKEYVQAMAAEIQQAVIDVLIKKTLRAARTYGAKTIILGGGVAANDELRKQLIRKIQDTKYKIQFLIPPKNLCTDNAVMTGIAGYFRWLKNKKGERWQNIKAEANLRV